MENQNSSVAHQFFVKHFSLQQSPMDPQSVWGRRARVVANVQGIFLGASLLCLVLLCILSPFHVHHEPILVEALKWAFFLGIALSLWGLGHLSKSFDPELHPLLAVEYAYSWRSVNYFFVMVDCCALLLLSFNPLIVPGHPVAVSAAIVTSAIIDVLIQSIFIFVVDKHIGELEAAMKAAIRISLPASAPPPTPPSTGVVNNIHGFSFANITRV